MNQVTIDQVINQALEIVKNEVNSNNIRIEFNWAARLFFLLNERSNWIFNGRIFHEAIKGIVNDNLYLGNSDKRFKSVIKSFISIINR